MLSVEIKAILALFSKGLDNMVLQYRGETMESLKLTNLVFKDIDSTRLSLKENAVQVKTQESVQNYKLSEQHITINKSWCQNFKKKLTREAALAKYVPAKA